MPSQFWLPEQQFDFRCPCGALYYRQHFEPGVMHTCPWCGTEFYFKKPRWEAQVDRIAESWDARISKARRW